MKRTNKVLLAMIAVAGISAASFSYVSAGGPWGDCANGGGGMYGQRGGHMMDPGAFRRSSTDRSAGAAQRLDMLKYQLRITESQEPAWQAFEQAFKSKMEMHSIHAAQRQSAQPMGMVDHISRMRQGSAVMAEIATSMEALYAVLTPEQKAVADAMRPMGMGRMH